MTKSVRYFHKHLEVQACGLGSRMPQWDAHPIRLRRATGIFYLTLGHFVRGKCYSTYNNFYFNVFASEGQVPGGSPGQQEKARTSNVSRLPHRWPLPWARGTFWCRRWRQFILNEASIQTKSLEWGKNETWDPEEPKEGSMGCALLLNATHESLWLDFRFLE